MKSKIVEFKDNKYYLNKNQFFSINKDSVRKKMEDIKFPIMIMDTEFFNKSHLTEQYNVNIDNKFENDSVYVLQYSFAKNFREISNRNNFKAVKSMSIKRLFNDKRYNFESQYDSMIKSFINMCINKEIKTLVFAGSTNDVKILRKWVNDNKVLLNNHKSELFIFDDKKQEYNINSFDIYDILASDLAFSNNKKNGDIFYNPKNLKKGYLGNDSISIPSLRLFYEFFSTKHNNASFLEADNIYKLCCSALLFFNQKEQNIDDFSKLNKDIKQAKAHCYNDVLKLLTIVDFLYSFSFKEDLDNKFVKAKEVKKDE